MTPATDDVLGGCHCDGNPFFAVYLCQKGKPGPDPLTVKKPVPVAMAFKSEPFRFRSMTSTLRQQQRREEWAPWDEKPVKGGTQEHTKNAEDYLPPDMSQFHCGQQAHHGP